MPSAGTNCQHFDLLRLSFSVIAETEEAPQLKCLGPTEDQNDQMHAGLLHSEGSAGAALPDVLPRRIVWKAPSRGLQKIQSLPLLSRNGRTFALRKKACLTRPDTLSEDIKPLPQCDATATPKQCQKPTLQRRKTAEFERVAPFVSQGGSLCSLVLTSHSSSLCLLTTRTLSETRYAL